MPDNNSPEDHPQQALGKYRIVWRDDKPMVALDQDGVVSLRSLTIVPDALWNTDAWAAPYPSWAEGVADPADRFLAMVVELDGRRRIAISELEIVLPALREVRCLKSEWLTRPTSCSASTRLACAPRSFSQNSTDERPVQERTFRSHRAGGNLFPGGGGHRQDARLQCAAGCERQLSMSMP
jgi:hypothetical protein